jgi:alpha-tubulin suppressor-like RCC1 family protein
MEGPDRTAVSGFARPGLLGAAGLLMILFLAGLAGGASGEQASSKLRRLQAGLVDAGGFHNCALLRSGAVRCWGDNFYGQLGYGNTEVVGDDETPDSAGPVKLGGKAVAISGGEHHSCALLRGGAVRCWGDNTYGQLGYGNTEKIGDDEAAASAGPVQLGGKAVAISAGANHTCALLRGSAVRCWGLGSEGELGYGNADDIGDDETPGSVGPVKLGGKAVAISAGSNYTCALLEGGAVRCWGYNFYGQLGYGNTDNIGDDETPASVGPVKLGGKAVAISGGGDHTCATLGGGAVRCWGDGSLGMLGYGNTDNIGNDETPLSAGPVELGGKAVAISAGQEHACALLVGGLVRCWGYGGEGQLGYDDTEDVGDDETPLSAGPVQLGEKAVAISAGALHTCALLDNGAVRCWGRANFGQLGYGNNDNVGDDETPGGVGPVALGGRLAGAVGDISLRVAVSDPRIRVGQGFALLVKLRDSGPDPVPGVVIRLKLPRRLTLLSANPSKGTYNRPRGNWRIGKLAAGRTVRLKLAVEARHRGRIAGSAFVEAAGAPDPDSKPADGRGGDDYVRFRIRALDRRAN